MIERMNPSSRIFRLVKSSIDSVWRRVMVTFYLNGATIWESCPGTL